MISAESKRAIVAGLGFLFLGSLLVVAYREVKTERQHNGQAPPIVRSRLARECRLPQQETTPGIPRPVAGIQARPARHRLA